MDIELLFQTLLKLYVMLLLGLVLAKVHILDEHSNRSLSQMVVSVTYPLMLLYSMAGQPGERSTALIVLGGGFVFYFVMIAVAKIAARLLRVPEEKRREFECLMVFGNTGFVGAPLAQSFYGNAAFYEITLLNFAYYFLYNTYAVKLLSPPGGRRGFSLRDLLTPGFIMTLLSIILYLLRYDAPAVVKDIMYMVGSMTVPLSMIILGSSLASYSFRESFRDPWVYVYSAAKLLLMPAIVFALCRALPIGEYYSGLTVISAAVPAGSMILMLALQMKRDSSFISLGIFVSTLLSALTLPIIAIFFL